MSTETRTRLLTEAEIVVRRLGYAGFSYADLAERVGLRKASIHYHFPTKEDLGFALVVSYTERFAAALADITASTPSASGRLDGYAELYRSGLQAKQGCLCGVLASELIGLPDRIRTKVQHFFKVNADWLEGVVSDGQADGSFRSDLNARSLGVTVLAGLQGAMVIGQALASIEAFDDVTASLAGLRRPLNPQEQRA